MGIEQAMFLANSTLWMMMILSLPTLLLTTVVSLLFSLFQAVTQIQDQVLPFAAKFVTIVVVLMLSGAWMYNKLANFFLEALALTEHSLQSF